LFVDPKLRGAFGLTALNKWRTEWNGVMEGHVGTWLAVIQCSVMTNEWYATSVSRNMAQLKEDQPLKLAPTEKGHE